MASHPQQALRPAHVIQTIAIAMPEETPAEDPAAAAAPAAAEGRRPSAPAAPAGLDMSALATDPASESIAVYARLKPVGSSDTRGPVEVSKRFGKQKSVQVKNLEFSLDWIFADDERLRVVGVAPRPPLQELTRDVAMPSAEWPSDHVSLCCDFVWRSSDWY